ncbi:MAG: thioredoxin family protein [Limnochordaceae bacterium]|nr:thioredoxin family protein [Limnochordaceae bacterium]
MRVEILGTGCPKCKATEQVVRQALAGLGIQAEVLHVTDPLEIRRRRVMFTPAVVIDGELVSAGHVPTEEQARGFVQRKLAR